VKRKSVKRKENIEMNGALNMKDTACSLIYISPICSLTHLPCFLCVYVCVCVCVCVLVCIAKVRVAKRKPMNDKIIFISWCLKSMSGGVRKLISFILKISERERLKKKVLFEQKLWATNWVENDKFEKHEMPQAVLSKQDHICYWSE